MTDDMHSCSYFCERPECIKRQRDELREQVEKLNAERDAWRKLVMEHNAKSTQLCRSGNVECRVTDSYSGCVTCPELYQIGIPPELEQS